jgi:hypothetical protein
MSSKKKGAKQTGGNGKGSKRAGVEKSDEPAAAAAAAAAPAAVVQEAADEEEDEAPWIIASDAKYVERIAALPESKRPQMSNCRKCGDDYWYTQEHTEIEHPNERVGEDICYACVSIRKIPMPLLLGGLGGMRGMGGMFGRM